MRGKLSVSPSGFSNWRIDADFGPDHDFREFGIQFDRELKKFRIGRNLKMHLCKTKGGHTSQSAYGSVPFWET
jgi:hypothetical protein